MCLQTATCWKRFIYIEWAQTHNQTHLLTHSFSLFFHSFIHNSRHSWIFMISFNRSCTTRNKYKKYPSISFVCASENSINLEDLSIKWIYTRWFVIHIRIQGIYIIRADLITHSIMKLSKERWKKYKHHFKK